MVIGCAEISRIRNQYRWNILFPERSVIRPQQIKHLLVNYIIAKRKISPIQFTARGKQLQLKKETIHHKYSAKTSITDADLVSLFHKPSIK